MPGREREQLGVNPARGRPTVTIAVVQRENLALLKGMLDRVTSARISCLASAVVDPDALGQVVRVPPRLRVHHRQHFHQGGSGLPVEWLSMVRGDRLGERGGFGGVREVHRRQGGGTIDDYPPIRSRTCPDREPALLQSGDVALDGADTDLECGGELFGSAASGTRTAELFADRIEPGRCGSCMNGAITVTCSGSRIGA